MHALLAEAQARNWQPTQETVHLWRSMLEALFDPEQVVIVTTAEGLVRGIPGGETLTHVRLAGWSPQP
jgi:hypothetical protein